MKRETVENGLLSTVAVISLAMLIQGMVVWRFLQADALTGMRGLIVGLIVAGTHGIFAACRRPVTPRRSFIVLLSLLAAVAYLLFALARSESTTYGTWKVQGFVLFAITPAIAISWNLAGRQELIHKLLLAMLVFSFAPLALPVLFVNDFGTGPLRWLLTTLDVDVIGLGRTLGVGALLCVGAMAGRRRLVRAMLLTACGVMLAAQVLVGERGPILALLVGVLVYLAGGRRRQPAARRGRLTRLLAAGLGTLVIVAAVGYLFQERAAADHEERRLEIAVAGWDQWRETPLIGVGLGHFSYDPGLVSDRQFFHNTVGEVVVELGLIGLAVFVLYFWVANSWRRGPPRSDLGRRNRSVAVALLAYAVTAAMVSGDLATNYQVWVAQALVFAASQEAEEVPA